MAPLVSVALPVYKRLAYVPEALRSLAAQDYPDIELIVSDNGQNGDAVARMAREQYGRPFVFRQNAVSAPIVTHFNQLIDAASGQYFVLLSDDDTLSPNFISATVARLEANPRAAVALARVAVMDEAGNVTASTDDGPPPPATMSGVELIRGWCGFRHKFVSFTTNLSRTAELRALGRYPDFDGGNGVDNALLVKQVLGREVAFVGEATFSHRIYETSFGKSVSYKSLALATRQFLAFLDRDLQLRDYARAHPAEWAEARALLRRMITLTYYGRWKSLYRGRMSYWEWVRGGFALPPVEGYYRKVLPDLIYSVPALAALARGARRLRPRASRAA